MLVTGDEVGVHVRCESYGISVDAKILMVWIPAECCEAVQRKARKRATNGCEDDLVAD